MSFSIINKNYEFKHAAEPVLEYLNKNADKDIKLYTEYSFGSLFEYYGYKPYLDSRAEVFIEKMNNKEDILKEYIIFNLDETSRDKFIEKYDFDYYVISNDYFDVIEYLLNHKEYNFELILSVDRISLVKRVN